MPTTRSGKTTSTSSARSRSLWRSWTIHRCRRGRCATSWTRWNGSTPGSTDTARGTLAAIFGSAKIGRAPVWTPVTDIYTLSLHDALPIYVAAGGARHPGRDGTDQRQDPRIRLGELRPQSAAVLRAPGGAGDPRGRSGDGDGLRQAHSGMPHGGDSGGPGNARLPVGTARSHAIHQGARGRTEAQDRPLRPGRVLPAHGDRERERCGGIPAAGGRAGDGRGGHVDDRQQSEIGRESGAGGGAERGVRAA